jgi:hypothetical protein
MAATRTRKWECASGVVLSGHVPSWERSSGNGRKRSGKCGLGICAWYYTRRTPMRYGEYSHLQYAVMCSCHLPPRPSAAASNLQWGTRSTHGGVRDVLPCGTASTRTCSMRRYADVIRRLDRRQLRLCRRACGGVLGELTVGHSAYSRGCRLHAPLVLSRVAGPLRCGNKQTRLRRQRQQAMRRCGWEQPSRCALLSRSAGLVG